MFTLSRNKLGDEIFNTEEQQAFHEFNPLLTSPGV